MSRATKNCRCLAHMPGLWLALVPGSQSPRWSGQSGGNICSCHPSSQGVLRPHPPHPLPLAEGSEPRAPLHLQPGRSRPGISFLNTARFPESPLQQCPEGNALGSPGTSTGTCCPDMLRLTSGEVGGMDTLGAHPCTVAGSLPLCDALALAHFC